jgi:hypothetical protein
MYTVAQSNERKNALKSPNPGLIMVLSAKKKRREDNQNRSIYMNYEKVSLPKCFIPKSKFKRYIANHRTPNAQSK